MLAAPTARLHYTGAALPDLSVLALGPTEHHGTASENVVLRRRFGPRSCSNSCGEALRSRRPHDGKAAATLLSEVLCLPRITLGSTEWGHNSLLQRLIQFLYYAVNIMLSFGILGKTYSAAWPICKDNSVLLIWRDEAEVELLLRRGAAVDLATSAGWTPVMAPGDNVVMELVGIGLLHSERLVDWPNRGQAQVLAYERVVPMGT